MRFRVFALCAAVLSASAVARADQMFTFSNVTLEQGGTPEGTLTGSFKTNDALNTILSYDITASASGSFQGFEYTTANSSVSAVSLPAQYFQLDSAGYANELRIYFSNGLSASGGTISPTYSYEHEPSGGNRFPSGSVVPRTAASVTPEPGSVVLLGTGLLGFAGVVKRRLV